MGISNTFDVSGTALNAQSISMDVIARNMANSQIVSGTEEGAYRAKRPVFSEILYDALDQTKQGGVKIDSFAESQAHIEMQRMPEHPLADENGYVYLSNVSMVEEMANMIQTSRSYQSNVEVMNTSRQMILKTLSLGN